MWYVVELIITRDESSFANYFKWVLRVDETNEELMK